MKPKLLFALLAAFLLNTAMKCDDGHDESEPAKLVEIAVANLNNEKEKPFKTSEPIKKEAYVLGVYFYFDNSKQYGYTDNTQEKIICNTDFDAEHPAGSDITSFFIKTYTLDKTFDHCFVLRKIPQPGNHSFKLIVACKNGWFFEKDTELINLY